ncbi:hypothetical protein BC936DRAFT_137623 [Jimgerdemannia flammicorona]|uniref:Copper type II ascorbate-dependent monooxygenase N-terminal domain-containing protein n=1 Tax=Jimgerdemannia flammicorona TaxID=994334 RepID=A0A433DMY4_9FUNG|nr:hypothetical protein BC936DRAFT_137623 [Jimgerdemannia flammicorona]
MSKETKYICTGFAFNPTIPNSNTIIMGQIVQITPLIDPSMAMYVHHYIVYACDSKSPKYQQMLNKPTECSTSNFFILDICPLGVYYPHADQIWAPGTGALTFPANIGLPFSNASDTFDTSSLVIEVHYNNDEPNITPNLTDISGLSITYTTTEHEHDAGLISIGNPFVFGGFMPFGSSKVEKQVHCRVIQFHVAM